MFEKQVASVKAMKYELLLFIVILALNAIFDILAKHGNWALNDTFAMILAIAICFWVGIKTYGKLSLTTKDAATMGALFGISNGIIMMGLGVAMVFLVIAPTHQNNFWAVEMNPDTVLVDLLFVLFFIIIEAGIAACGYLFAKRIKWKIR